MLTDSALLHRYAREHDQAAFAEIVRRHLNLVYSAAVRRVGDRHLAEDVTQAVFMILARKPNSAARSSLLSAWLLNTVRYASANALKIERRRRHHHDLATACASSACSPNPSEVLIWREIVAHLDDAVLALPARDRQAILLRYFQDKQIGEIAAAMKTSEGAAKQRLSRSIEKLRKRLNKRGAVLAMEGAAGLSALLAAQAMRAAPASLNSTACASAAAGSACSATSIAISKGAITMMTLAKLKTLAAIFLIASALGTGLFMNLQRGARAQNQPVAASSDGSLLRQRAAARVQAAQQTVDALRQRAQAREPLTPTFVELQALAERRLVEAQIDATDDPAARAQIVQKYVQQCRDTLAMLNARMRARTDVSEVQVAQSTYHLADAEYILARLQAGR